MFKYLVPPSRGMRIDYLNIQGLLHPPVDLMVAEVRVVVGGFEHTGHCGPAVLNARQERNEGHPADGYPLNQTVMETSASGDRAPYQQSSPLSWQGGTVDLPTRLIPQVAECARDYLRDRIETGDMPIVTCAVLSRAPDPSTSAFARGEVRARPTPRTTSAALV